MRLLIFGAGASYASQNHLYNETNLRSPITNEFFDPKYLKYAEHVNFTEDELNDFKEGYESGKNLEVWLTNKWNQLEGLNQSIREIDRALFGKFTFYIWSILWNLSKDYKKEENLYFELLRKLKVNLRTKNEEFRIITFNYDTFLDKAYTDVFNTSLQDLDDYLEMGIIKPHGSINWILPKRANDKAVERRGDEDIKTRINLACRQFYKGDPFNSENIISISASHNDFLELKNIINQRCDYQYFYPLIFIPLTKKLDSLINGFYKRIIDTAIESIRESEKIYVIGYRAKDNIIDEILNEAKSGTELHVISNGSANEIATGKNGICIRHTH